MDTIFCFQLNIFPGNQNRQVSALFRAIGAHYLDHYTVVFLPGLCLHPRDPHCKVGSLYPVTCARKMKFRGPYHDVKSRKEKDKLDFSQAQGRFSKAEFPEAYALWEEAIQTDCKVSKLVSQTKGKMNINPRFERGTDLTVVYSTSNNANKLRRNPFGAALAQNEVPLEDYPVRAVNLNGCLFSKISKCGRKDNIAVVLAIKDICGPVGSCLPLLPEAIKRIVAHFARAVVVAGLPEGEIVINFN